MVEAVLEATGAAGEEPDRDRLTPLVNKLNTAFRLSPTDMLRVQRTALLLASRGVPLDDEKRLAVWLAPIVCRSPGDQRLFYALFGAPEAVAQGVPSKEEKEFPPPNEEAFGNNERREPRHLRGRLSLLVRRYWGLLGSVLLVLFAGHDWSPPEDASKVVKVQDQIEQQPDPVKPSPGLPFDHDLVALIASQSFLVAFTGVLAVGAQRRFSRNRDAPSPVAANTIVFERLLPSIFNSPEFRHSLGYLRRHQSTLSRKLHVRRTIAATVSAGGRPILRYGTRPRTPEYVVLADRRSPQDLLPTIAEVLVQRLAEEKISATLYEFYRDPRRLKRVQSQPEGSDKLLADLAPSHPGARLLVLAERQEFMGETGSRASWLQHFTGFDRPTLLDPGLSGFGSVDDAEGVAFRAVPASESGLLAYGRDLASQAELSPHGDPLGDPFLDLAQQWRALIDDVPPEDLDAEEFLHRLEASLGERGFRVLKMVSVFPLIEPAHTLLLIDRVCGGSGDVDFEILLKLARLPWMRHGHLPAWLRRSLAERLQETELEMGVNAALEYLAGGGARGAGAMTQDQAWDRSRLLEWLQVNRGSELFDTIFMRALSGAMPNTFGAPVNARPQRTVLTGAMKDTRLLLSALGIGLLASAIGVGGVHLLDRAPPVLATAGPHEDNAPADQSNTAEGVVANELAAGNEIMNDVVDKGVPRDLVRQDAEEAIANAVPYGAPQTSQLQTDLDQRTDTLKRQKLLEQERRLQEEAAVAAERKQAAPEPETQPPAPLKVRDRLVAIDRLNFEIDVPASAEEVEDQLAAFIARYRGRSDLVARVTVRSDEPVRSGYLEVIGRRVASYLQSNGLKSEIGLARAQSNAIDLIAVDVRKTALVTIEVLQISSEASALSTK